jgi:hypothetical protein
MTAKFVGRSFAKRKMELTRHTLPFIVRAEDVPRRAGFPAVNTPIKPQVATPR